MYVKACMCFHVWIVFHSFAPVGGGVDRCARSDALCQLTVCARQVAEYLTPILQKELLGKK